MIRARYLAAGAIALALSACASAPMHYYTLVPGADVSTKTGPAAAFQFALAPVGIPAQVDQPQLVVRQGGQGIAILDSERWSAPLADEVHGALAADLAQTLHAQDVAGLPTGKVPVLRIAVDLRRFDSRPGDDALIDAAWSLRSSTGAGAALACTTQIRQPLSGGSYQALVQGHQQALQRLAQTIAAAAGPFMAGQSAICPAG